MGNSLGGRRRAKVMKIDGETFKLKTPTTASEVTKDHPGYVLLDSNAVKHFGIRAKPLEPWQQLKPKKIYFLVELPKVAEEKALPHRRVQSGINMSAKDRLEYLMLSRRAVSDLTIVRPPAAGDLPDEPVAPGSGPLRVKMRLPRAQVAKLMEESKDEAEVAEKVMDLYRGNYSGNLDSGSRREMHWRPGLGSIGENNMKTRPKRVSFAAKEEAEIQLEIPS
ncbi:uncharacterized protein At1g66480-like [Carica papaya]|uniref:uncharacterized protein At1g66480-like n=1 Tax=Carica papaya TaxID=3649 RepID=UPI000B8C8BA3|nr:uncharacterized protein At1g66480-like [Carica papaya]